MDRLVFVVQFAAALFLLAAPLSAVLRIGRHINFGVAAAHLCGACSAVWLAEGVAQTFPAGISFGVTSLVACVTGAVVARLTWALSEAIGVDHAEPDDHLFLTFFIFFALEFCIEAAFGARNSRPACAPDGRAALAEIARWAGVGLSLAILCALLLLRQSGQGLPWLAAEETPELAGIHHIDTRAWRRRTATLAGACAGTAGSLQAWDVGIRPHTDVFIIAAMAALLGGIRSFPGVALGCLLFAIIRQASFRFDLAGWEVVFQSAILLLILLARPRGIFHSPPRLGDRAWT